MRLAFISLALLALVSVDAKKKSKASASGEGDVLQLTTANFDAAIKENDPLLVAFVAPWCGHCKQLKPAFAAAAKVLAKDGLKIAQVDATAEAELATRFEVQGFPTIKFFRGGKPTEYNGGRDKEAIVSWVKRKSGPSVRTVTTEAQAADLLAANDVAFLAFVSADSAAAAAVSAAADASEESVFAIVPAGAEGAEALRAAHGVEAGAEALVAVNKFEGQPNRVRFAGDFSGEDAAATVTAWAAANALPLVVTFTQESARKIFAGDLKTHFLLFANEGEGEPAAHASAVAAFRAAAAAEAASDAPKRALFVRVPLSEAKVREYFGIGEGAEETPAAVLVNMAEGGMKKYKAAPGGAEVALDDAKALTAFLDGYSAGSLKAWLKTEPAPDKAENDAAPVKTITGSNFAAEVVESSTDVLLEVYAPWCGHCKSLAPVYESLGKAVQAAGLADKLTIAKMDGTANEVDHEGMTVKGFPTIFFFKAGEKTGAPMDFDGGRDVEGFVKFLKEHSSHDVSALSADAAGAEAAEEEEEEDGADE